MSDGLPAETDYDGELTALLAGCKTMSTDGEVCRSSQAESATQSTAYRNRLGTLLMILASMSILLMWALSWDPVVDARMRAFWRPPMKQSVRDISKLIANDPPVGADFSGFHSLYQSVKETHNEPFLIVSIGNCQSCMSVDLKAWAEASRRANITFVILGQAERKVVRSSADTLGLQSVEVIADPDGKFSRILNACVSPRCFLFSQNWTLKWIQRDLDQYRYNPFLDQSFIRTMKE